MGLLCENFITTYGGTITTSSQRQHHDICIDVAAKTLGVERRRIYDIINILEAIHIVSRKCKNTYYWHGINNLQATFGRMQKEAFQLWKNDAIRNGLLSPAQEETTTKATTTTTTSPQKQPINIKCGIDMLLQSAQEAAAKEHHHQTNNIRPYSHELKKCKSSKVDDTPVKNLNTNNINAKEKSLGKLSQKFIQLFLVGNDIISLTEASDKILGPDKKKQVMTTTSSPSPGKRTKQQKEADTKKAAAAAARGLKTKIRRLYDIANVMVSIGVIEKINSGNMNNCPKNRPSFRWVYHLSPQDILSLNQNGTSPSSSTIPAKHVVPISFFHKVQGSNCCKK